MIPNGSFFITRYAGIQFCTENGETERPDALPHTITA